MGAPRIDLHPQYQPWKFVVVRQEAYKRERVQEAMPACNECVWPNSTKDRDQFAGPPPVEIVAIAYGVSTTHMNPLYHGRYRPESQHEKTRDERVEEHGNMANIGPCIAIDFIAYSDEFAIQANGSLRNSAWLVRTETDNFSTRERINQFLLCNTS